MFESFFDILTHAQFLADIAEDNFSEYVVLAPGHGRRLAMHEQ